MGDFLTTPNKSKESFDGENTYIRFGSSAMQGWRYRMEDAHITFYDVMQEEGKTNLILNTLQRNL